jgi:hypothetical protein
MADAGRSLWAARELLDRTLRDCDGNSAGKVDDLEFDVPRRGARLPVLTNVLTGQAALVYRFSPRLARGVEALRRVTAAQPDPGPGRIPWSAVKSVDKSVSLSIDRWSVPTAAVESWLVRHILRHIPLSGVGEEESAKS